MRSHGYLDLLNRMNPLVIALLHTPVLHWLVSPGLMTISLRGRRSGGQFRFPVGYHDQGDAVLVLVADAEGRQWWRNFKTPWPAVLRLRGHNREMIGVVLEPGSDEYIRRVELSMRRAAFMQRIFGIDFDPQLGLTDQHVKTLGEVAAAVCFRPSTEAS